MSAGVQDFADKVALVTGASAGIGAATAELLAARGARVALVGRDEGALREVAARCGDQALTVAADLATEQGCELVARRTLDHFGRVDVLINNAGTGSRDCLSVTAGSSDMATFDRVFALNVRAVYCLTRLLTPALVTAGGNIVNVSGIAGSAAYVGCLSYSMSKAALDHFTDLIALELAPKGVRVNTVSPGITESKFVQRLTGCSDTEYAAFLRDGAKKIPLRRVCAAGDVAAAVAAAVAHLASPLSSCVTGAKLFVDGGRRFVAGYTGVVRVNDNTED